MANNVQMQCQIVDYIDVLSATGGMANEACAFYTCLASLLCEKWSEPYTAVLCDGMTSMLLVFLFVTFCHLMCD